MYYCSYLDSKDDFDFTLEIKANVNANLTPLSLCYLTVILLQ